MSTVAQIVDDVRAGGAAALALWALRLDGVEPRRAEPADTVPLDALRELARAVTLVHEGQRPPDVRVETFPGVVVERRWVPLRSVGIYVPRGLLSTLVMCAVPARLAGVERIVVVTPPTGAGMVAAAAQELGLGEVWAVGGPHAIAGLAYGAAPLERVDKIVGPGNAYVDEAKRLVSADVAIDFPAGPSELVVLASKGADEAVARTELAAQAEHGPGTRCRLVAMDGDAAALAELDAEAPEHVLLLGDDAEALAPRIRNAGAVFVGRWSSVAAGDLATGGNHVLPTGGRAAATGGLGLETFLKPVTVQTLTREGLGRVRRIVEALAAAEGLPAHAEAVRR